MTRFKELARIQSAIKHKNVAELRWASGYCNMRVQIATRRDHVKHWRAMERKISDALRNLTQSPN